MGKERWQGIEESKEFGGFTLYSSPKIIGERKVARYTGGGGGGVSIVGFTLYSSPKIIGEIKVARY